MPDVYQLARAQREALIAADVATARALARTYREQVLGPIEARLTEFYRKVDRARARGVEPSPAWAFQEARLRALIADATARMEAFQSVARKRSAAGARDAIERAMLGQPEVVDAATPAGVQSTFTGARPDAIEAASAQASAATSSLRGVGSAQAKAIEDLILGSLAAGDHPRQLARRIRDDASLPLSRALTIARTEQLRAYRTGSHLTYQQAADVLDGWVWLSAADARTCAACWAMHGTLHPLTEEMGSHPNCRCVPVPKSRGWAELGADPDLEPQLPTPGPLLFRRLPVRDQRRILGPGGFRLYRAGDIDLPDLVERTSHDTYGPGIRRAPLRRAVERAGRSVKEVLPQGLTR